jgi:hypothetical protein
VHRADVRRGAALPVLRVRLAPPDPDFPLAGTPPARRRVPHAVDIQLALAQVDVDRPQAELLSQPERAEPAGADGVGQPLPAAELRGRLDGLSTIVVSGRLCSGTHLELAPCLPLPFV